MNTSKQNKSRPFDWKGQIAALLAIHGDETVSGEKVASHRTHMKRAQVLYASFGELRDLGFKLSDVSNLRTKHIKALVGYWEKDGQSPSTIQNKISIFRVFSKWIDKNGMIGPAEGLVKTPGAATRSYVAVQAKGWDANDVPIELIDEVESGDLIVGMQLRLCRMFGLRMQEAVQLRPHRADKGDYLVITDGTKGGRARVVPIKTAEQRDLLVQCKNLVGFAKNAHMGMSGKTLKQNKRRFYTIMDKFGINKKTSGVTAHGLRHEYVNRRYEEMAGGKSPVEGGTVARDDPELDHEVRIVIAEEVGHTRPSIVSCYSGSRRTVQKPDDRENKPGEVA